MKDVWRMTKAELQKEADDHMKALGMRRIFGGPVSKDEWERDVLDLRDERTAQIERDGK